MSPQQKVIQVRDDVPPDFVPYGGAWELWKSLNHQVLLHGPADTGKTRTCLEKVHAMMQTFDGARAVCVRRFRSDLRDSTVYVLMQLVYGGDHESLGITTRGQKENPDAVRYSNGSVIYFRGLDDPQKALGGAFDIAFASQAEELTEQQWEFLVSRVSGRAKNTPYPQVLADANPAGPEHWLLARKGLQRIQSRHRDNPDLYTLPGTEDGVLTPEGKVRIGVLHSLTGVTKKRLLHGEWVAAEGVIYDEFLTETHVVPPVPPGGERYLSIDFGWDNPTVVQWWLHDDENRLILTRELYETHQIVEDIARRIEKITSDAGEWISLIVCDRDPERMATLERQLGVTVTEAMKGKGSVQGGIDLVKTRLRPGLNDLPHLLIASDSLVKEDDRLKAERRPTSTRSEFGSYMWRRGAKDAITDEPIKKDDHGMDAMRYMVLQLDAPAERTMVVHYRSNLTISDY